VPELSPALEAKGLGYRFADCDWAFRNISLELRSGELGLLAGRNGSGKTFLAKNLAGLLEPSEGELLVGGKPLTEGESSPAAKVGYVFQDARLQIVGETVMDDALFGPTNLGLASAEAGSRAESALAACGLSAKAEDFVHTLSGGELRKLAIAGVLALRPGVLILDEPFANLDPEGICDIVRLVRDLRDSGLAILVVTHEIEKILGLASFFAVMEKGELALSGDSAAVLEAGIERYGLRDPFAHGLGRRQAVEDLVWL
jgi:ABC-type cobalt transport system, ATPase component